MLEKQRFLLPRQRRILACARTMIFVQAQMIKTKECPMLYYMIQKWRYIVIRIHLNPKNGVYACQVPKGAWHAVKVYEPSVINEARDGAYGSEANSF